jgi:hemerythrin-like domain-containing protein
MTEKSLVDTRDLTAVHTMLRREFGLIPELVLGVDAGDAERTTVVADHVVLVSRLLGLHHAAEDEYIWPLLREHGGAETELLMDVMECQHEDLHKARLLVDDAVGAWRESVSAEDGESLVEAVQALVPRLEDHLALEEERVLPLIERQLSASEYARLGAEGAARTPAELLPTMFGMVIYGVAPEVADAVVTVMPAEARPFSKETATAAYAAYAEKVYGTATPPRVTA